MVGIIWLSFLFQQVFMLIMMMNYIIAIVSQSWDEVKEQHYHQLYESRCHINFESAILMDAFRIKEIQGISELLVFKGVVEKETTEKEFHGFVHAIKNSVKKELQLVKHEIRQELVSQIQDVHDKVCRLESKLESKLEAKIDQVQSDIQQLLQLLHPKQNHKRKK